MHVPVGERFPCYMPTPLSPSDFMGHESLATFIIQRIQDIRVGFIDPYIVFKTGIIVTGEYHDVLREAARQDNNTFPVQL